MWTRAVTFGVWAALAASALFWGLKLWVKAPAAPPQTQLAQADSVARGDLSRLLGSEVVAPVASDAAPEPAADARFSLIGVLSPRQPQAAREGLALISVDGQPPKAYRVGAQVDGSHVLQSVSARGASLGPAGGTPVIALNLPPPAPAATGQMPPAPVGGFTPPVPPARVMPAPGQRLPPPPMSPQTVMPIAPPLPMTAPPNSEPEGTPMR